MDLEVPLESPQRSKASSRVETCTSAYLLSCSSSISLTNELTQGSVSFPRSFPTGLSHEPPWCESILSMKVDAVQGNLLPLEQSETCGGLLEWWHDPGVPLDHQVEIGFSGGAMGTPGFPPQCSREKYPTLGMRREIRGSSSVVVE